MPAPLGDDLGTWTLAVGTSWLVKISDGVGIGGKLSSIGAAVGIPGTCGWATPRESSGYLPLLTDEHSVSSERQSTVIFVVFLKACLKSKAPLFAFPAASLFGTRLSLDFQL